MAAKFTATTVLASADVGADAPNFPAMTLSGAHNDSTTTITLTATVLATWPTAGWVLIDSEIVKYTGKAGATLTSCTRGDQGTTAASHSDAASVYPVITKTQYNQIVADLIAVENWMGASANIASATPDLSVMTGHYAQITGTTAITAFGTVSRGRVAILEFAGILTLTHNATSLIMRSGANATTAAGDIYAFVSEGAGNWREIWHLNTAVSGASILDSVISDTTNSGSSAETTMYTKSIAGNTIGATGRVRLTIWGDYLQNNTGNYTMKVKFGATTVATSPGTAPANSASRYVWFMTVVLQNTATGTQRFGGILQSHVGLATGWAGTGAGLSGFGGLIYGTSSIDTTAAATLAITVQNSTASVNQDFVVHGAFLELMP